MPMIEMKVFGLAVDEDSQVPVLILKDKDEQTVLPIWIGAMEAMAISLALNGVTLPRPMTHDLLLNVVEHMQARLMAVDVISLQDGTYYAELEVEREGKRSRIDCRPSDGIALALRAEVPISVSDDVLRQAAADHKAAGKPEIKSENADKWTELLENLDVDDKKYKM
jgi:hypothetical protein